MTTTTTTTMPTFSAALSTTLGRACFGLSTVESAAATRGATASAVRSRPEWLGGKKEGRGVWNKTIRNFNTLINHPPSHRPAGKIPHWRKGEKGYARSWKHHE